MNSVAEQIKEARRRKGWTQEALAEKVCVTRAAVANWEQGRRSPDPEMMIRLSEVMEYEFQVDRATMNGDAGQTGDIPEDVPSASGTQVSGDSNDAASSDTKESDLQPARKKSLRKWWFILAGFAICLAVAAWLWIIPALSPKQVGVPYTSATGEVYTPESLSKPVENMPGKAYLKINPGMQISHGDAYDFFIFKFDYHEMNGIAMDITRLELVYFLKKEYNAFFDYTAKDLTAQFAIGTYIAANGDWAYTNGLPVQNTISGVAQIVHGIDENGEELVFYSYLPIPEIDPEPYMPTEKGT